MPNEPLEIDKRIEAAFAVIDTKLAASSDDKEKLILWKCRALIWGYHQRWQNAPYTVESVENYVTSDLWNPSTERKSRSFILAGKLDSTGYAGRRALVDHKTTSSDIADPNSPYWKQLMIEGQVSHYMLLEWLNGRKVDEAIWDVMRKPSISPRNISKADITDMSITKHYFGTELTEAQIKQAREDGRESLELYAYRLAWDATRTRPEWYFQRRTVPRIDADLLEYAKELWEHSQDLLYARRENRWPRNSGACMLYGSPCKFLGICSGYDTADSDNWTKKAFVHNELVGIEGDGRNILTNSRVRCFQTCRRKHYLEYELGIERQDEEEKEALVFGTTWHEVLEAWFNASKGESNVNVNSTAPANGVGISDDDRQTSFNL